MWILVGILKASRFLVGASRSHCALRRVQREIICRRGIRTWCRSIVGRFLSISVTVPFGISPRCAAAFGIMGRSFRVVVLSLERLDRTRIRIAVARVIWCIGHLGVHDRRLVGVWVWVSGINAWVGHVMLGIRVVL